MQLRPVGPEVEHSWITFLLREGYTLDAAGSRLGRLPAVAGAPAGARPASRLWDAFAAAARRGAARIVERRQLQAMRHIRRVRAQCGYGAEPSPDELAGIGRR